MDASIAQADAAQPQGGHYQNAAAHVKAELDPEERARRAARAAWLDARKILWSGCRRNAKRPYSTRPTEYDENGRPKTVPWETHFEEGYMEAGRAMWLRGELDGHLRLAGNHPGSGVKAWSSATSTTRSTTRPISHE